MREEFIRRRLLHDFSRVHQRDVMRHLADNREVMRDEEKRQTAFRLESEKQIENLFLQRHIERRGRLIRDHEVRVTGKRHRDHAALFLPAGKLERERVHAFLRFRNADPAEPGDLFLGFLLSFQPKVPGEHFANLIPDRHHGVKRRGGLLEDHSDPAAPPA